ncbi:EmrB/QacA subfamily drug resistance transporter [Caballeronia udeis]|uniref:EmrB/QacA subfamily drug resistance transporter n=1 Tax=Caballeronia udeis TaxID=1232866 RepID=A0ABW8MY27_9BURK
MPANEFARVSRPSKLGRRIEELESPVLFSYYRPLLEKNMKVSKNLLVMLCVSVPSFMINLDGNIISVSLSSIARSLHADFAAVEWVISAYTLTFAAMLMPAGTLADRFGRKRMLIIGLILFTLASALCGAAQNDTALNWARTLQGVGAALQLSAAMATLSHAFRGLERARAFSFWGSVVGAAITLGPVVGGLITQYLGWRWVFFVNLPVGIAMIALTLFAVEDSKDPQAKRLDIAGVATFSGFLILLTLALISGNRAGWSNSLILGEFIGAGALLAAFLAVETRQPRPMVDLYFFKRPTYVGANIAGLAYGMAFLTMLTYLPLYFQNGMGHTPLASGLLMLPMAVPLFVIPRVVARWLAPSWSGRLLLTTGLTLVGVGLIWTSTEMRGFAYEPILVSMLVASCGAGVLNEETARVGMTVIPADRAGMASGVSGTVKFSGIVIGFATLGAILFSRVEASLTATFPRYSLPVSKELARMITGGHFHAAQMLEGQIGGSSFAQLSFGSGYEAMLMTAGAIALIASALSWMLVDAGETAPIGTESIPGHIAVLGD